MIKKKLTPVQSIKKYCRYSCCSNDLISWKKCPSSDCPLHGYRLGKRPKKLPFISYMTKTSRKEKQEPKQAVLRFENQKNDILEEGLK